MCICGRKEIKISPIVLPRSQFSIFLSSEDLNLCCNSMISSRLEKIRCVGILFFSIGFFTCCGKVKILCVIFFFSHLSEDEESSDV